MTNKKEVAQAIWCSVCEATWDVDTTYFEDDSDCKKFITTVLRELVAELQYDTACWDEPAADMVLDARAILDVCDELEKLTTYD
jgi:hypothetical protein